LIDDKGGIMSNITYENFSSDGDLALDENTHLYQYLSTDKFISLLGLEKIWLRKVTQWDDFREGEYQRYKQFMDQNHALANRRLEEFYGSCWSLQVEDTRLYTDKAELKLADEELARDGSDAMWRAYCPAGGVRIRTTQKKLKMLLLDVLPDGHLHGGRVYYAPLGGNLDKTIKSPYLAGLFHKRVSFRSEAEYRFIFSPNTENKENCIAASTGSNFDIIDDVVISPARADRKEMQNCSSALVDITQRRITELSDQTCRISRLYGVI
jgi:hypothetical protein